MKSIALACLLLACLLSPLAAQNDPKPDPEAPITVNFVKMDFATVIQYITRHGGLSIEVKGNLKFEVTVSIEDAKPAAALRLVCEAYGLKLTEEESAYIVSRHDNPHALLSVEFEDTPLKDVALKLSNLSGLNIVVPRDSRDLVTVSASELTAVGILRMICEAIDLRVAGANKLLRAGTTIYLRPSLSATPAQDLQREASEARLDLDSLRVRREIVEVVREAVREEGDEAAIAEAEQAANELDRIIKALTEEIAEIEAELTNRKAD